MSPSIGGEKHSWSIGARARGLNHYAPLRGMIVLSIDSSGCEAVGIDYNLGQGTNSQAGGDPTGQTVISQHNDTRHGGQEPNLWAAKYSGRTQEITGRLEHTSAAGGKWMDITWCEKQEQPIDGEPWYVSGAGSQMRVSGPNWPDEEPDIGLKGGILGGPGGKDDNEYYYSSRISGWRLNNPHLACALGVTPAELWDAACDDSDLNDTLQVVEQWEASFSASDAFPGDKTWDELSKTQKFARLGVVKIMNPPGGTVTYDSTGDWLWAD